MARLPSHLATFFAQALKRFEASGSTFRVLCSLPSSAPTTDFAPRETETETKTEATPPNQPPKYILVLDSSFNPPTLAHHRMVVSALSDSRYKPTKTETKTPPGNGGVVEQGSRGVVGSSSSSSAASRVLLLLAINNADKAPKPAAFSQRLAMMYAFAQGILADSVGESAAVGSGAALERGEIGDCEAVDIAVTTEPYFHAKAQAIATSDFYQGVEAQEEPESAVSIDNAVESEQVYLTGYDTLIRIFNPKYYPDNSMKASLDPFFAHAGLRVTMRTDDGWGDAAEQISYLDELRTGKLEEAGGRVEWVDKIELVQGRKEDEAIISSTKVRDAARREDWKALEGLVGEDVVNWIRENNLYVSDDR